MSTHKHFNFICYAVIAVTVILTVFLMNAGQSGIVSASEAMGYENKLFDTATVHSINIEMDDWDAFLADCKSEEYYDCTVTIDDEVFKNVAIRGKGNTSLSQVNNDRYSFKIEFDHYDNANTYHGLDKLCLNNIIQDNTYMKDYLTYQMMADMDVAAPLCSYTYITVNGEEWGLYLAVEGVEDSFLQRNYGKDYGQLYKPDSMNMGGGRGNGKGFDMDAFMKETENGEAFPAKKEFGREGGFEPPQMAEFGNMDPPEGMDFGNMAPPEGMDFERTEPPKGADFGNFPMGGMFGGRDDVLLKYIDDTIDSYSNIFDSAKTEITTADKKRLIAALKDLSEGRNLSETVDIEEVIRYFVVHNFVLNFDSYTGAMIHNYYLYENDGQMQMIPWDYNLAFGGFEARSDATSLVNYPIDSPVSGGDVQERPMIAWIFADEEYKDLYHAYFEEYISAYFESGYFEKMIDGVTEMIAPYVEKDPTKFCAYEEFEKGVAALKEFCLLRAKSIRGQLDGNIGKTNDTQVDGSLIDASELVISDMGSMGNMGRGMGGPMEEGKERPMGGMESAFR